MREPPPILFDRRLTTAEILYFLPDYPLILQMFLWQELDVPPDFPRLKQFLSFWEQHIEGKLHEVTIASCEMLRPASIIKCDGEFVLH